MDNWKKIGNLTEELIKKLIDNKKDNSIDKINVKPSNFNLYRF